MRHNQNMNSIAQVNIPSWSIIARIRFALFDSLIGNAHNPRRRRPTAITELPVLRPAVAATAATTRP